MFLSTTSVGTWRRHGVSYLVETAGLIVFRLLFWASLALSAFHLIRGPAPLRWPSAVYLAFVAAAMLPYMLGFGYTRHVHRPHLPHRPLLLPPPSGAQWCHSERSAIAPNQAHPHLALDCHLQQSEGIRICLSSNPAPTTLARTLLLLIALTWGATFTLVKAALDDASPLLFNLLRFTLATLALLIVNRKHLRTLTPAHLKAGATAGFFLAAGYQFQTLGLARTTPAKSGFITGLIVVFVPLFTLIPFLRPPASPRPGPVTFAGALLAFIGLIFLTTPPHATLQQMSLGDLLTLICSIAFALHLLTLARVSPGIPSGLLATLQIAFATLFMLLTLPFEPRRLHVTPRLVIALLICSLIATAAAFTIQSFAQRVLPPTQTVLILTLEPVFAWLTSLLILHDTLSPRALLGAALIFAAILIIELAPTTHTTELPA